MRIRRISPLRAIGWPAWIASLALVALLGAVVAHWAVTLFAPRSPIAPPALTLDPRALPELQQAGQLFGVDRVAQAPAQLANVQVLGIVAAGARGSAILGIDGKPARAFAVGEQLNATQRLIEVRNNAVVIGNGAARYEVAPPPGASLAVLSSGANQPAGNRATAADEPGRAPGVVPPVPPPAFGSAPLPGIVPVPPPAGGAVPVPGLVPAPVQTAPIPPPAPLDASAPIGVPGVEKQGSQGGSD